MENLISVDALLSVQSTISEQSLAALLAAPGLVGCMDTTWGGTGEGCGDGHTGEHFRCSCCSWSPTPGNVLPGCLSPVGLLWLEEPAMLPANHTATSQHPFLQAVIVLLFHIQEGVSHVYYLFQLFLHYKSNKKGQQCYFTLFAPLTLKSSSPWLPWPAMTGSMQNSKLTGSQDLSPGG